MQGKLRKNESFPNQVKKAHTQISWKSPEANNLIKLADISPMGWVTVQEWLGQWYRERKVKYGSGDKSSSKKEKDETKIN